jgi:RNA polymerase sigma factor (sigma-70 family)
LPDLSRAGQKKFVQASTEQDELDASLQLTGVFAKMTSLRARSSLLMGIKMTSEPEPGPTHPSLLLRIRDASDEESWRTFVSIYAPLIYRSCRRRGLQDADAADVGQEVLAQVARSIRDFEYQPGRGRFRDWLGSVVRNKVWRFLQNERRGVRGAVVDDTMENLGIAEADGEWVAEFHAHLLSAALGRIRDRFEPPTWSAFEEVWLRDRASNEVARDLGLPIDVVYLAKSRVLKRLRDELITLAEDLPEYVPLR